MEQIEEIGQKPTVQSIYTYIYICNMYIMYTQCKVKVVQHVLLTPPVAPNSTGFSTNYLLVAELYPAVAPKI